MGRDPDPSIKEGLTEKILEYLLLNGIQDLSLRPLAKALETNARMLIYHFGSKEKLIIEALELAQKHQIVSLTNSPVPQSNSKAELLFLWKWFSSDQFLPFSKLLFEIETQAMNGNTHYRLFATEILAGWVSFIQSRFLNCNEKTANLIVNTFSGLLLDRLITTDIDRIDSSFESFSELLVNASLI